MRNRFAPSPGMAISYTGRKLGLNPGLGKLAAQLRTEEMTQKKLSAEASRAVKAERFVTKLPGRILSDADVLAARALYEFGCRTAAQVAAKFDLSPEYTKKLLQYTVRSGLVPKRKHLVLDS